MPNVGILFGDQENPFWQEQLYWYNRLLPDFSFVLNAELFFPDSPRDAQCQAGLFRDLLERGFDALIVNPLDGVALADVMRRRPLESAVFDVGPKLIPELTEGVKNYVPLRATDFFQQGWLCGQELVRWITRRGPFACISGPEGTRQSAGRIQGAQAAALERHLELLPPVCGGFTREGGRDAMTQLLPEAPCALFCANDLMALGALDILREHDVMIPVGGVDLIPEALALVREGAMTATAGPRGEDIVRGALRSVARYLERGELPGGYLAQNVLVTREAAASNKNDRVCRPQDAGPERNASTSSGASKSSRVSASS